MPIRRGERGEHVRQLQRGLLELGVRLPRWGADGALGNETFLALARLLGDHGQQLDPDAPQLDDDQLAFFAELHARLATPLPSPVAAERFFDLRAQSHHEHVLGRRQWTEITGICLHQTACVLGSRPLRWASLGAHLGVTRQGEVMWIFGLETKVVHGNGWNSRTVGIELEGMYAGVQGDPRTFRRPPSDPHRQPQTPTAELVEAARATIRWVCAEVTRHGGQVTKLVAHRQSSSTRRADPGSALWQELALPMQRELALDDGGKGFCIGTGAPIPESWNPAYTGERY